MRQIIVLLSTIIESGFLKHPSQRKHFAYYLDYVCPSILMMVRKTRHSFWKTGNETTNKHQRLDIGMGTDSI